MIVPIKAFHEAKARLADELSPTERGALARWTAARVLGAAGGLARFVVCDHAEVAEFARAHGAEVLWKPGLGLNAAVQCGVADVARLGTRHVVVAHSDLPLAADLDEVIRPGYGVLVADRHGDGTNVISLPTAVPFTFRYGAASFRQHLGALVRAGVPVEVRVDPLLALDVDRPADLHHPLLREVAWQV